MAFENRKDEFEKAISPHFRAHPAVKHGNRRVPKSFSIRPDIINELQRIANEKEFSLSHVSEDAFIKYIDNYNKNHSREDKQ